MKAFLIILSTLLVLTSAQAKKAPTVYTVGAEAIAFMPYSNFENNEYTGVFKQILDDFAKSENIEFKYAALPISRLYTQFFNQKLDFKIPSNKLWKSDVKEKRKVKITYSQPVLSYIDGVMSKAPLKNKEQLKTLGLVTGFTAWNYLGDIKSKKIKTRENPSVKGLLKQSLLGRIDGAYVNIANAKYYLNKMSKPNGLHFNEKLPHTNSYYALSTIKHPELIKKFNAYLIKNKSKIREIQDRVNKGL